jgi:hypothetical protein
MNASTHTERMRRWWAGAGIDRADLAVRRPDGAMLWHYACLLDQLPLPWARAHNVRRADVYVRPARGASWPLVFLDDLAPARAQRIARRYAALVVQTSPDGGCHLWLRTAFALDERQRGQARRYLAHRTGADPGSVSGEHLGRLAGMKNHKRRGVWVNVLEGSRLPRPPWDPSPALQASSYPARQVVVPAPWARSEGIDSSESGREWGWVCGALAAGASPERVYRALVERATPRRGRDAETLCPAYPRTRHLTLAPGLAQGLSPPGGLWFISLSGRPSPTPFPSP